MIILVINWVVSYLALKYKIYRFKFQKDFGSAQSAL